MWHCAERFEIVSIDISLNNASALVTFDLCAPGRKSPQYRIENRSSAVSIKYKQQDADHLQLLKPNTSAPFAWDEVCAFNAVRPLSAWIEIGARDAFAPLACARGLCPHSRAEMHCAAPQEPPP